MLPPVTESENRSGRFLLTDAGHGAADSLSGGELSHGLTEGEAAFLAKLIREKGTMRLVHRPKLGVDASACNACNERVD